MELLINVKLLQDALKFASTINNQSTTSKSVLIEVKEQKVVFKCHSGNIVAKTEINSDFECIESGSVMISPKLLLGFISKLKEKSILLKLVDEKTLEVKSQKFETFINTYDVETFPLSDLSYDGFSKVNLRVRLINEINNKVLLSTNQLSNNPDAMDYAGVFFDFKNFSDKIAILSTDKSNAILLKINKDSNLISDVNSIKIPTTTIKLINEILKIWSLNNDDEIRLYVKESNLIFDFKNFVIKTKLLSGSITPTIYNYFEPDYKNKIFELELSRRELMESLERGLLIVSKDETWKVIITVSKRELTLLFNSYTVGTNTETITLDNEFDDEIKIALNANFLMNALKLFDSEKIQIIIENPDRRPIIVLDKNNPNFKQVISKINLRE